MQPCPDTCSRPPSSAATRSRTGWSNRAMLSKIGAAHAHACDLAASRRASRAGAGRRHHRSRSATWSAPASTSSPTARSAARATPTASPPRSRASTPTTRAIVNARSGMQTPVPRVVGKITPHAARSKLRDMQFLRRNTDRAAKITLPGPFTMSQQAKNEFYKDDEEMAMDFAAAVNAEALDLQKAGADVIQLDEPWLRNDPEAGQALRGEGDQPRAARASRCRPSCICASAMPPWCRRDQARRLFLPAELADSIAEQISIEAAQPKLDLGVLKDLSREEDHAGRARPRRSRSRDRPPSSPTASATA